tara:strand:+ start:182 stop:952 length:771 start_codon:yes stop_codon:yes gene_type:complete
MFNIAHHKGVVPNHHETTKILNKHVDVYSPASNLGCPVMHNDKITEPYIHWLHSYFLQICKMRVYIEDLGINCYGPNHCADWHEDDPHIIVTMSFGESRKLQFSSIKNTERLDSPELLPIEHEFTLGSGDMFIFHPDVNNTHCHCVPKDPTTKGYRFAFVFAIFPLPYENELNALTPFKVPDHKFGTLSNVLFDRVSKHRVTDMCCIVRDGKFQTIYQDVSQKCITITTDTFEEMVYNLKSINILPLNLIKPLSQN